MNGSSVFCILNLVVGLAGNPNGDVTDDPGPLFEIDHIQHWQVAGSAVE